jgi:thiol-disulfide isomerase/thioredoxin
MKRRPRGIEQSVTGLVVCAAVLAAATVFGAVWQRRSGVLRAVRVDGRRRRRPHPGGAVAAGTAAPGTDADAGSARSGAPPGAGAGRRTGVLTAAQLGHPLGSRATLVQFSTAFCAPCRATRRILADVAGMVEGVAHVDIDAEANLGLVRSLAIHSTPTVIVLGADGAILRRGTGQPRKPDVIAVLGAIGSAKDSQDEMGTGRAAGPGRS